MSEKTLREAMKWCGYAHLSDPIGSFKPDCAKCWAQVEAALAATADAPEGPWIAGSNYVGEDPRPYYVTDHSRLIKLEGSTKSEAIAVRDALNRLHTHPGAGTDH